MGFRYRRSIRLGRSVRINLSKSGPSLSIGKRGSTVNFGPHGTRLTIGIPGTGLSYQTALGHAGGKQARRSAAAEILGMPGRSKSAKWKLAAGVAVIVGLVAFAQGGSETATMSTTAVAEAVAPPRPPAEGAEPIRDTVEVSAPANIRTVPRSDLRIIGLAARNDRYSVFGRSGASTQVGIDHALGWVGNSRLTLPPP